MWGLQKWSYTIHDSEYPLTNCLSGLFYLTKDSNTQNDLMKLLEDKQHLIMLIHVECVSNRIVFSVCKNVWKIKTMIL